MLNKEEIEKRISSTNEAGLVSILYEAMIDNFKDSIDVIDKNDWNKLNYINNNSRDILAELLFTLRGDSNISNNLKEIYIYTNKIITIGENKKDKSYFETAIKIIQPLKEGFDQIEKNIDPKVVTGLTYGRSSLDDYQLKRNKDFQG
ncbi:flagellar protein FliS [Anaerosalibacter massiliensis]|uniref:Flagellar protein FliS n=1 Tax=Anaerosalibacter massiliensis TaxID=1347392 RepID=A0A9X2MNJ4_9FIRM|nr:flagellar protein FliS [Anaerosalibacter massiliensis]MCR2044286.1 flagellar protein FliS [Anaerosalibacter massiliensis]